MTLADLKYVTTGAWGSGLARPLTAAEADGNIQTLRIAVQDLIDNPPEAVSISNVTVSGRNMTVYTSDGGSYGPFALPVVQPRYRGEWDTATSYAVMDIFQAAGFGTYLVAVDHTSSGSFNPALSISGNQVYVQIAPDASLVAQCLDVTSSTLSLNYTHIAKYIRCDTMGGTTVTVPYTLPENTEVHFRQVSTGGITLSEGFGVTINVPAGFEMGSASQGATFTLKHISGGVFDVFGALAEVTA